MRVIGIIPARGGSKGIPRKNIKPIAGKPLIAWTLIDAKKSIMLDNFYVSTDDEEIASISRRYGANIIMRPKKLANDKASVLDAVSHAAKEARADVVVILQPTSPIRGGNRFLTMIDEAVCEYFSKGADSLATGYICKNVEWGKDKTVRRQDSEGFFYDDGNIYVLKASLVHKGLKKGKRPVEMITSKIYNFEIDDETDFFIAEQIIKKREREKHENKK